MKFGLMVEKEARVGKYKDKNIKLSKQNIIFEK